MRKAGFYQAMQGEMRMTAYMEDARTAAYPTICLLYTSLELRPDAFRVFAVHGLRPHFSAQVGEDVADPGDICLAAEDLSLIHI